MSRLSEEQKAVWAKHIQSQQNSKLGQQAYCRTHNLVLHQFTYWKRKLNPSSQKIEDSRNSKRSVFVPVQMTSSPPDRGLCITLSNGISINGISNNNQLLVLQLVEALK